MATGFVDEVHVSLRAGDGGDGAASFHREKYKPKGKADGGDGGRGGSIIFVADANVGTLSPYKTRRMHKAASGERGAGNTCHGASASDVELPVPVGTIVIDSATSEILADLAVDGVRYEAARGGRGGRGNHSITSAAERAPTFAEMGEPGQEIEIDLELRLVADVGLLGAPNAGKSTLLGAISAAHPKIASYPFTTLEPSLGVIDYGEGRFVVADLPGLIEGAAEGKGLGTRFLRHTERCGVLAAVVDLSSESPVEDLQAVVNEVSSHSEQLADLIRVVVGTKTDLPESELGAEKVADWAASRGIPMVTISSVNSEGLEEMLEVLHSSVEQSRADRPVAETYAVFRPVVADEVVVERDGEGWRVTSSRVTRLLNMISMTDYRAVRHLQRRLASYGVDKALKQAGAQEGDEVYIGDSVFEYHSDEL